MDCSIKRVNGTVGTNYFFVKNIIFIIIKRNIQVNSHYRNASGSIFLKIFLIS